MTGFLKAWTMSVAGIIVFGSICEMILPGSLYKKYVHLAIGLMMILSVLSPIVKHKINTDAEIPRYEAYEQYEGSDERQKGEIISVYKRKLCEKIKGDIEKSISAEFEVRCEVSEDENSFGNIEKVYIIVNADENTKVSQNAADILKKNYGLFDENISIKYLRQDG